MSRVQNGCKAAILSCKSFVVLSEDSHKSEPTFFVIQSDLKKCPEAWSPGNLKDLWNIGTLELEGREWMQLAF